MQIKIFGLSAKPRNHTNLSRSTPFKTAHKTLFLGISILLLRCRRETVQIMKIVNK